MTFCLSVKQPWADLLVTPHPTIPNRPIKDIENRKWGLGKKRAAMMPFKCYIQASLSIDKDGFPQLREQARLARVEIPDPQLMVTGAIVGMVTIRQQVRHSESPWFIGPVGFELVEPVRFPNPVSFPGQLGFFWIEDEITDQVYYEGLRMSEPESTYVDNRLSGRPFYGPWI